MNVVEPFFMDSGILFEAVVHGIKNPMRFGDIYDRDYWKAMQNCSELVTWENFISKSSRNAILVLAQGFKLMKEWLR